MGDWGPSHMMGGSLHTMVLHDMRSGCAYSVTWCLNLLHIGVSNQHATCVAEYQPQVHWSNVTKIGPILKILFTDGNRRFFSPASYNLLSHVVVLIVFFFFKYIQLHGVDDNIGKSKKILTSMSRRMSRNKWIIGSVIAVLVLAIILILYFKLSH